MLRRASTTLFCALAFIAPAYSQDVFVPRELKAVSAHPPKPKDVVRRVESVTDADSKPTKELAPSSAATKTKISKVEPAPVKTEKAAPKEKSPAATDDTTNKKVAKAEPPKEKADKIAPQKEKSAPAKTQPAAEDLATIKVEKKPSKEPAATKAVAKTETAKEKASPTKEKADSEIPTIIVEKATGAREPGAARTVAKTGMTKTEPPKEKSEKPVSKEEPSHKSVAKNDGVKVETVTAKMEKPAVKEKPATVAASRTLREEKSPTKDEAVSKVSKTEMAKPEMTVAKTEKSSTLREKEKPATIAPKPPIAKSEALIAKVDPPPPREGPVNPARVPMKSEQVSVPSQKDSPQIIPTVTGALDTGFTRIADGFDFPVGKPEAEGYYKARGFRAGGHVGEDWDGVRGGDTDLGDPIYSIGDGIVVFARDVHLGWGNVVIVRHAYRDSGNVRYIDALYGHLDTMLVSRGQRVSRGQQIATMGTAHGQYDAHLHFEIRKNLEIGMSRSKFQKDFSNYYDPTQFINSHRHLSGGGANYKVAMNTFTQDWAYHFDSNRNFGPRKRSTSQSSAALRKALTSR
jgi:murein DD-endopeptidase MepM/ murein hydrolase activator NlpD